jgi:hypothetical protein
MKFAFFFKTVNHLVVLKYYECEKSIVSSIKKAASTLLSFDFNPIYFAVEFGKAKIIFTLFEISIHAFGPLVIFL